MHLAEEKSTSLERTVLGWPDFWTSIASTLLVTPLKKLDPGIFKWYFVYPH